MTAEVLAGRPVAERILADVWRRAVSLRAEEVVPRLVFVTEGSSAEADVYTGRLARLAGRCGIEFAIHPLPALVSVTEMRAEIAALNADPLVDGMIVQMPLPPGIPLIEVACLIDPRKDVDGITVENGGLLYLGLHNRAASTGLAMMELLAASSVEPAGRHAVVVGRSQVVGHPVAELLLQEDATVTVTHRQTVDLAAFTRQAEILMLGAGEPHLITPEMVSPGVVIIDAGINVTPAGIVGDAAYDALLPIARAITPVPGGVGPVTNAVLLRHVVESAEQRPR